METIVADVTGYAFNNAQTLMHAPLVFAAALIIAFTLAYLAVRHRYGGVLDQKDATIQSLATQLDGLRRDASAQSSVKSAQRVHPNTQADALKIDIGAGDLMDFETLTTGATRSVLYLQLTNVGDGFLTDCSVSITHAHPPLSDLPRILAPADRLFAGEHKRIPIAHYFSGTHQDGKGPPLFRFPQILGGGAFAGMLADVPAPRDTPLLITLEATGRRCSSKSVRLKLSVDEADRLTAVIV
jgi:hypothetical protein